MKYNYGYGTDNQVFVKTVPSIFGNFHIYDTGDRYVVYGPDKYCTFVGYEDNPPPPLNDLYWGTLFSVGGETGSDEQYIATTLTGIGSQPFNIVVTDTGIGFINQDGNLVSSIVIDSIPSLLS